jgi:hypothetical protein
MLAKSRDRRKIKPLISKYEEITNKKLFGIIPNK